MQTRLRYLGRSRAVRCRPGARCRGCRRRYRGGRPRACEDSAGVRSSPWCWPGAGELPVGELADQCPGATCGTRVPLLTAVLARRAGTTAVIGTAGESIAHGIGYRRIAVQLGRPSCTAIRWVPALGEDHHRTASGPSGPRRQRRGPPVTDLAGPRVSPTRTAGHRIPGRPARLRPGLSRPAPGHAIPIIAASCRHGAQAWSVICQRDRGQLVWDRPHSQIPALCRQWRGGESAP
jgi:hypothetical protein